MTDITEIFERLNDSGLSGQSLDDGIKIFAHSYINEEGVVSCKINDLDSFFGMADEANYKAVTNRGHNIEDAVFVAIYSCCEDFPFPRFYFYQIPISNSDKINKECEEYGLRFELMPPDEFHDKYKIKNLSQKMADFHSKRKESMPIEFKKIIEGRMLHTSLDHVMAVNTKGCLCCDTLDKVAVTSTFVTEKPISCLFWLCLDCLDKAENDGIPVFEFLNKHFGFESGFSFSDYNFQDILEDTTRLLEKDLECENISFVEEQRKIVAYRKESGFKILIRLGSPTDYAYVIFDKQNKEIGKFDSADHHIVDGGPHHLHYHVSKKKYKKVVAPSWFIGCPHFDLKGFKAFIKLRERGL